MFFHKGFEWNDSIDMQLRSSISQVDASKTRSLLPASSSLSVTFLLFIINREQQLCVLLIHINCRTIIYAKKKRLRKEDIIINSFSPFHSYYHVKRSNDFSCDMGLNGS